jgi:hypothetical protein
MDARAYASPKGFGPAGGSSPRMTVYLVTAAPRFTTHSTFKGEKLVFDVAAGMRIGENNPLFPQVTDPS